eukprot:3933191-Rhodomonas_salina.1
MPYPVLVQLLNAVSNWDLVPVHCRASVFEHRCDLFLQIVPVGRLPTFYSSAKCCRRYPGPVPGYP